MAQRLLIATCLFLMLASIGLVGFVSHQSNQALRASADANRQLAERFANAEASNQARMAELLRRSELTGAELLKQLQAMARPAESPRAPDWIPVSFKLTRETVDGPPATGYQVVLHKGSGGLFERGIRRESDSTGLVDFGVVQPGDWEYELSAPYDEQHTWTCTGTLNVLPGTKVAKTIICPNLRPEPSRVKLRVALPPDLDGKNLSVIATFVQKPVEYQPSLKWKVIDSFGSGWSRTVLCVPGIKQSVINGATGLKFWNISGDGSKTVFVDIDRNCIRSPSDTVVVTPGDFLLRRVIVLRLVARKNTAVERERFETLAYTRAPNVANDADVADEVYEYPYGPDSGLFSGSISGGLKSCKCSVNIAPQFWRQLEGRFVVRPGQSNDWMLPLSEELLNTARQELKGSGDQPLPDPEEARDEG